MTFDLLCQSYKRETKSKNSYKVCVSAGQVLDVLFTHHYEVPHARGFSHQRGDAAAAGHQDDLKRLRVEEVIEQLGGFSWVTLRETKRQMVRQTDRWKRESIMRRTNKLMGLEENVG